MDRIHPPRKLRFHWNGFGARPEVGDFLQTPTQTTYEILEAKPAPRTRLCFLLLVWRIAAADVPAGARIIGMHWLKRGKR
jgi:hypothetical protein